MGQKKPAPVDAARAVTYDEGNSPDAAAGRIARRVGYGDQDPSTRKR